MGKANDLYGIDIATMGEGPQLSNEKEWMLETHVNESETVKALKDIGDLKTLVQMALAQSFLGPHGALLKMPFFSQEGDPKDRFYLQIVSLDQGDTISKKSHVSWKHACTLKD